MSPHVHPLPLRVYQTAFRIMVAAPMPGLEPRDIAVTVTGDQVTIHGKERGPHQHERALLRADWTIGPYAAEVALSEPVNGALTNVTYGNGVLVVVMPKVRRGEHGVPAEIRLEPIEATRGERVGHVSRTVRPTTTEEHLRQHAHRVAQA
jgi:HSP20 family protein